MDAAYLIALTNNREKVEGLLASPGIDKLRAMAKILPFDESAGRVFKGQANKAKIDSATPMEVALYWIYANTKGALDKEIAAKQGELDALLEAKKLSKTSPKFQIGQRVTFINDYGVSFPHRTITGIVENPRDGVAIGYDVTPTDTPWYPHAEDNLYYEYDQEG